MAKLTDCYNCGKQIEKEDKFVSIFGVQDNKLHEGYMNFCYECFVIIAGENYAINLFKKPINKQTKKRRKK